MPTSSLEHHFLSDRMASGHYTNSEEFAQHITSACDEHSDFDDDFGAALREAEIASLDGQRRGLDSLAQLAEADCEGAITSESRPRRTPDERREQNRLTVQRFYYRKKVRDQARTACCERTVS